MNKTELRQKYKQLRMMLSETEKEEKSLAIANSVVQLPIWEATYFHIFLPIVEQNEIDTAYILHILAGKDKEIVLSKSDFESREMAHFLLTDSTKIKKNNYNIPEPINGLSVPVATIEVVFVPLLAFDKLGNRVGYGKGFYDIFLSKCRPATVKIGLSFFEAEEKIDDASESDIQLDYCITPNAIHVF